MREAVVNAVVHRDYAHEGTDVEISLYVDRFEVISPGRLPNGVTVEKMREGVVRVARNELLKEILRDYRYGWPHRVRRRERAPGKSKRADYLLRYGPDFPIASPQSPRPAFACSTRPDQPVDQGLAERR